MPKLLKSAVSTLLQECDEGLIARIEKLESDQSGMDSSLAALIQKIAALKQEIRRMKSPPKALKRKNRGKGKMA